VYSHVKDNKIHVGVKPEEVYEIFNGNACGNKKSISEGNVDGSNSIDQSTLQYRIPSKSWRSKSWLIFSLSKILG